jgi:hypothetical protein
MNSQFNEILEKIADELDIPDSIYRQIVVRYKTVGQWLQRNDSAVRQYAPTIYPQGSMRLGTVVKPINDDDDYDVDLVCELNNLDKASITQAWLKEKVGDEVKSYARANSMNSMPEEGRRCWTLNYADTFKFHMDILPCIPDGISFTKSLNDMRLTNQWSTHAIAITDNTSSNYRAYSQDWPVSNPKGYAQWFTSRMVQKSSMKALESRVEPIIEFREKTPLQQAIQILKRHRDVMFDEDCDEKPISIIITTLAASAYNGEINVFTALLRIVNQMEFQIQYQGDQVIIANPSNPRENFADKWQEHPERKKNFQKWLEKVKRDFNNALAYTDILQFIEALSPLLGARTVNRAAAKIIGNADTGVYEMQKSAFIPPSFFNVAHRQPLLWQESIQGKVFIECVKQKNGYRPKELKSGSDVAKYWKLYFKADTTIHHPYDVYWQVVNTGEDARLANGLRGEFLDGTKYKKARQWSEGTLYQGTHWIECFIVKNGSVVARSGEFIVNIA